MIMNQVAALAPIEEQRPNRKAWGALAVLASGLGLIVLDGTIVSVSLPTMIPDLGMTLVDAEWVNSLYAVIVAALLLATGSLSDRVGRRKMFLVGVAVFVLGSALAGMASGPGTLLAARAVQAVGGAAIMPSTLSTVNAMFRGKWRAAAFGIWGAVVSGAAAIGPLAGGALTEWVSWRWIFYVNLPIGLVLLVAALWLVPETRGAEQKGFDFFGLTLSAVGFGLLVFAVIEGPQVGWWRPTGDLVLGSWKWSADASVSAVPVAFGVSLVALVGFFAWEWQRTNAGKTVLLSTGLFKLETFTWGNVTAATVAVGEFSLLFVLPLFLVNVLGLQTITAGAVLAGMAGGVFVAGATARHIAGAIGPAGTVMLGLGLEIVGALALAGFASTQVSTWLLVLPLVIYGLGLGLASAQLTSLVLGDVPVSLSGQGAAAQSTIRQVGAALGTAFAGTALSVFLSGHLPAKLREVGVEGVEADKLADATLHSAGSNIPGLREAGEPMAEIANTLAVGFTQGTRISILLSAAFLVVGLIGAGRVRRAHLASAKAKTEGEGAGLAD